jgi:hypothetical protein
MSKKPSTAVLDHLLMKTIHMRHYHYKDVQHYHEACIARKTVHMINSLHDLIPDWISMQTIEIQLINQQELHSPPPPQHTHTQSFATKKQ